MAKKDSDELFVKSSRVNSKKKGKKKKSYNESYDHQVLRHQKINFRKYLEEINDEELMDVDE